jgi:hypothetical protein
MRIVSSFLPVLFAAATPSSLAAPAWFCNQNEAPDSLTKTVGLGGEVDEPGAAHCGQATCFLMLRRLGNDVSFGEVCALFDSTRKDASFGEIQGALRSQGVETIGVRASIGRLKSLCTPCIVQISDAGGHFKHFQVFEPHGNGVMILDPELSTPLFLTPEFEGRFSKVYSGKALVLAAEVNWIERHGRPIGFVLLGTALVLLALTRWFLVSRTRRTDIAPLFSGNRRK